VSETFSSPLVVFEQPSKGHKTDEGTRTLKFKQATFGFKLRVASSLLREVRLVRIDLEQNWISKSKWNEKKGHKGKKNFLSIFYGVLMRKF
jgi:hypothetical protein